MSNALVLVGAGDMGRPLAIGGVIVATVIALVVLVVLQVGISAPGVPGRIGVFQYLCILALALFQVDNATGLSYGILLQGIILVPTTLISLLFMGYLGVGPPNRDGLNNDGISSNGTNSVRES